MDIDDMRIAIAKAFGWQRCNCGAEFCYWHKTLGNELPDYCHDLNAIHEAEKYLISIHAMAEYWDTLLNVCGHNIGPLRARCPIEFGCHATAPHRAEAFLRTLKLWKS